MKTVMNRRTLVTFIMVTIFSLATVAQFNGDFLRGGIDDGTKIFKAYITPYANAFGAGFNSSWYNSAKPHSLGGFDFTISVSTGLVPLADQTFDLNSLGFETLTLENPGGSSIAPTVAGKNIPGPRLEAIVSEGGYDIRVASFSTPEGTGWKAVPVPMVQLGIGLPLGSELKVRYMPNLNIADGKISMFGGGLIHSITQWIPATKLLPLDVSIFGGYSRLNMMMPLNLQPDSYSHFTMYDATDFADQEVSMYVEAWSANVIGSFNLPIISFYGGLGYSKTKTHAEISGNYPLPAVDLTVSTSSPVYNDAGVITDIEPMDIKNFSGVRVNIGTRLKLGIFTIHADYTRANYNVFVGGLGLSFR